MTEQIINRRLGNQENLNNWDIFWEIYFDEVDQNNYQEVSLKNLILMNSTPNTVDFTDCFEKMLFTIMKLINIDRNPFTNNEIIDNQIINNEITNNDFMDYIVSNFDTKIIYKLTTDNAVEEYLNDLVFNDANLSIDIQKISVKLPLELMEIMADNYIDDTYKLRQNIEDLLQLDNPLRRSQEMIRSLIRLAGNENPHSFDVIKKFVKNGILTFNQDLLETIAENSADEAVDLIINNLQTPQNLRGTILNTPKLQEGLARNTNIRALNFYAENYRRGNFIDVLDARTNEPEMILMTLMHNKNSYPILDNLGIINRIRTNIRGIELLAYNRSDSAVNTVIPYLMGLNYINSQNILPRLANNTNPIAVRTIISYLRIYTRFLINSGFITDSHFERIIIELSENSNDEAVDYIFEILADTVLNYIPDENFWVIYILNTNDRAVNYILDNINIIYALPNPDYILMMALLNKHPRMRQYLSDNFLNDDIDKFVYLFTNQDIFEIDYQDRINKTQQIKTLIKNVNFKLNLGVVDRDQSIYGLE
jgi:hypothetical protein